MPATTQGASIREHATPATVPEPLPLLGQSELGHIALLLQKAGSYLRSHIKESTEIAVLADTDLCLPDDVGMHPETLQLGWITEPGLHTAVEILLRSEAKPYVIDRSGTYFLMVRR